VTFMGYDLYITRRKSWSDEGNEITAGECLAYVERDTELGLRPEDGPHFAEWRGGSSDSWLDWSDGQICTKNPEAPLIEKMVAIARQLGPKMSRPSSTTDRFGGQAPDEQ